MLNLIFLARSGSKTRACFLINTRTKSHDFVNCMTAQGRSSQIIPRAVQEQGLSHAGKCVWHRQMCLASCGGVRWQRSAESGTGAGSRLQPAWLWLRPQHSDGAAASLLHVPGRRAALPLGSTPLRGAPGMHRSRSLTLQATAWELLACCCSLP